MNLSAIPQQELLYAQHKPRLDQINFGNSQCAYSILWL